jgi:hypothetical protein
MKAVCIISTYKEWSHTSLNSHLTSICIHNFRFSHFYTLRLTWFWHPVSKHGVKLIYTLFYQNKFVLTVFKYFLLFINMELLGQNIKSLYFSLKISKVTLYNGRSSICVWVYGFCMYIFVFDFQAASFSCIN